MRLSECLKDRFIFKKSCLQGTRLRSQNYIVLFRVFDKSGTGKLSDKAVIEILSQQGDERIPRDEAHQFLEFAKDLFKEDQLSVENLVELLRPEDEVSHSSDID